MRRIIKLFKKGNVSVCGLRGAGKDMLFANVVMRRKSPYISNTDYGGEFIRFDPHMLNCRNTWRNFMTGQINRYVYPYDDGIDFYLADGGIYMPSQYQGELCKEFSHIPVYMAISRHLGECNFHYNVQNLNRMWDKIREQSDIYIRCRWCKVLFGKFVLQYVIIYEKYESAVNRVPPFRLKRPLINPDRVQTWEIQKQSYEITHGLVKPRILIYLNKSKYNTRIFKEMLENASNS